MQGDHLERVELRQLIREGVALPEPPAAVRLVIETGLEERLAPARTRIVAVRSLSITWIGSPKSLPPILPIPRGGLIVRRAAPA